MGCAGRQAEIVGLDHAVVQAGTVAQAMASVISVTGGEARRHRRTSLWRPEQ
jgi:hypothetical protein